MFSVKAARALTRPGVDIPRTWLLIRWRLCFTARSHTERRDRVSSRSHTQRDSARLDCPKQPGSESRNLSTSSTSTTTAPNEISVDFDLTRESYKSKDSLELLRGLVVFKVCSYDIMVDKNQEIMDLCKKLLGQRTFNQFMKITFYGQFVAGEDEKAVRPLIQKNQAFRVGSILDYCVEKDISQEKPEMSNSCESSAANESIGKNNREIDFKEHKQSGDRRGGVTGVCSNEGKCDQNMEIFIKCISASSESSMDAFSAIKMTALGQPQVLIKLSEVLVKWQRFFNFLALQQGKHGMEVLEQKVDLNQLQELLTKLGAKGDFYGWFSSRKEENSRIIDVLDWNSLLDHRAKVPDLLVVPNLKQRMLEPLLQNFTTEEEEQLKRTVQRMDVLAKHAVGKGVCLLADAEQTYFQPAISKLTLDMQRIYNREKAVVFNTYQCYLKEAYHNVTMDVELSRRERWRFAAKLVRGAYMYLERERARKIGYEDPINTDYESTNRMYHRCLDYVLDEIAHHRNASVMVASHNEGTVKHTLRRMNELGLVPTENKVYFAQLLGMCDQISFPLGQKGFPVYKYVPYGPMNEVMPYLSRRAQENRGFMKGTQKERELLWKELKRRLTSGELLYRPVH
ncbi:proline dehydrogenase 1, mitochondrial-like [Solea senegalensis]|uniref:Proline dehydrogenase n=1 Tax=Solea senegalensis TaxID=28829 RepID=A0AAV6QHA6_SOLSE|nr:proline dehydrogenase 1, mitochondrial [Solea senegalensis]KAG7490518.1 proline dehydrogenase 1, mitochondrial-like [Solea senegalensis]